MTDDEPVAVRGARQRPRVVTMNRPEYRNAQNSVMTYALDRAFQRAVDDDEVKVIVLAGAGKHFSAGHDIGTPGPRRRRPLRQQGDHLVGPRRARGRRPALRPRDGGLPRHVPALARDPQAGDRDGAGRVHRRRADAGLRLRPDRRLRRRVLRRSRWCGWASRASSTSRTRGCSARARPRRSCSPATASPPSARTSGAWSTGSSPRDALERRDVRDRRADRRDAALRPGPDQARGQPVRGRDGHAQRHGLGLRPAPLRARAQRRGRRRLARRHGREVDEIAPLAPPARSISAAEIDQPGGKARLWISIWTTTPSPSATRCATFLRAHVPSPPLPSMDTPDGFAAHREWEHTLADARLSVVSWPAALGGRDASLTQWVVFEEEYFAAGAPLRVSQNGIFLLAPTLFAHGTPEQLRADAAADGPRRRDLGAGLVGARGRQRPGRRSVAGRAYRRRLAAVRARRRGRRGPPTPTAASGCSAPTRTPSGTAG